MERKRMQAGWARGIAYLVLAALVAVTSCRAAVGAGPEAGATPPAVQIEAGR